MEKPNKCVCHKRYVVYKIGLPSEHLWGLIDVFSPHGISGEICRKPISFTISNTKNKTPGLQYVMVALSVEVEDEFLNILKTACEKVGIEFNDPRK